MDTHSEFVSELTKDIEEAVKHQKWDSTKADLTVLSEQIVQALLDRRDQDVRKAYESVERAYSNIVTRFKLKDTVYDAQSAVAELRAFTRLLAVALQYRTVPSLQEKVLDTTYRPILDALRRESLAGRELAELLKVRPETIARKLPVLRSAGLVRSQQVGKATINTITPEARMALDREDANRTAAEARAGNVLATRKVTLRKAGRGTYKRTQRRPIHQVQVVGTHAAQSIADVIIHASARLARINEAAVRKLNPIDLTIHFHPNDARIVANVVPKETEAGTDATAQAS